MPAGSVWDLRDYLPNLGAPLRKRGGYTYASADIAATTATASYVIGGIYAPFVAAAQLLAIDEDGRLYKIVSDSSTTDIGLVDADGVIQNPVFHREKVIIPIAAGDVGPDVYDGTTLAALGGSPPAGQLATVYKDRTVLAHSTVNPERVWFSDPGNPASWDTTNTYLNVSQKVRGLAALRNAILVFSDGQTARIRGSTPPPETDMVVDDPIFTVGCPDARSIAYHQDEVVFANAEGIYLTDGVAHDDLTARVGMKGYWQDTLTGFSRLTWTLAAGMLRNYYFITVMNGATFVDAAMIDLERHTWLRLTNIDAASMWVAVGTTGELYFGRRGAARVGKLSPIFSPSASVKNDADGDAVTPVLETPFYLGQRGIKGWEQAYLTYDLRDAATDNPTLTVAYSKKPEATSYTNLASTFAETTQQESKRRSLGFSSEGIALKITQTNASADTRLWALEAIVDARERSRRAA